MTRLLFAAALLAALTAHAQNYPTRPVKLLVPFPAGSATDQVARVVGAELQQAFGQAFVVENKAARKARSPQPRWRRRRPTATR
jgi:tripartite-type tricarboxylate transporter receptor subunit TctC